MYISNVTDIKEMFLYYFFYSIEKYIKKLLGIPGLYIKERLEINHLICVLKIKKFTHVLLDKFNNKRSELKYLSNFRKRNQTRFYN